MLTWTLYCMIARVLRAPKVADSSLSCGGAKRKAAVLGRLLPSSISEGFDNPGKSLILTDKLQEV